MVNAKPMKLNSDYRRVYSRGKSYVSPALVVYVLKNRKRVNRIGITAGKKIGCAVKRNRAKRLIREGYRPLDSSLNNGLDIVFVARKKTVDLKSNDLNKAMKEIFRAARILKS